jgi:hypothetical protein
MNREGGMLICALCGREVESFENNIERWILSFIKQQTPELVEETSICRRCVIDYESMGAVISLMQRHDLD